MWPHPASGWKQKVEELFRYLFLWILAVVPGCKENFFLCRCQCLAYAHTSCVGDSTSQPKQKVRWPSAMHAGNVGVRGRLMTIFYFILKAMSNVVLNIKIDGPQSCGRWGIWQSKNVLLSTKFSIFTWILAFNYVSSIYGFMDALVPFESKMGLEFVTLFY